MKENWLDKQRQEAQADPREQAIKKMFKDMIIVTEPTAIVPISKAPEFSDDAFAKGVIGEKVRLGCMGETTSLPIRTDNAEACHVFMIKTAGKNNTAKYNLIHVLSGELENNEPGARREDIAAAANQTSQAIGITGPKSQPIVPTARAFKYKGITTIKHIDVLIEGKGKKYISVVYRPKDNKILIRPGADTEAKEIYLYDGF